MDEKEVRRLHQKRKLLLKRMAQIEDFLRGSVVLMKRPCVDERCHKCASGERHPTWVLTLSEKGKTRTVYLGAARATAARQMSQNYRRLGVLTEEVAQINLVLLTGRKSTRKGAENGPFGQGP
jgi:hypothetical protein